MNLKEIVDSCLAGASLDGTSALEENEVKKYVSLIKGKLELRQEVQDSINNHLRLCTKREEPFSFTKEHLDAFKEAFCSQWTRPIVQVFRKFAPYEKYLSTAEEIGAIDGMLASYLLLSEENREKFEESEKNRDKNFIPHDKIHAPLAKLQDKKRMSGRFMLYFKRHSSSTSFNLKHKGSLFCKEQ